MTCKSPEFTRRQFLIYTALGVSVLPVSELHARQTSAVQKRNLWREARALVDAGAIGRPYYVGLRLPRGAASVDDVAGYIARVSYALRLDAPSKVSGAGPQVARDGFPADYMVSAKYDEGLTFSITTGPAVRVGEPYVMRGDAGTIRVYDSERPYLELEDSSGRAQKRVRGRFPRRASYLPSAGACDVLAECRT